MEQNLIQMPKTAYIELRGRHISLENHMITGTGGLTSGIIDIISMDTIEGEKSDRQILSEFEKYGISYEAAIEYCAEEIEGNTEVLACMVVSCYGDWLAIDWRCRKASDDFSESAAGRKIAEQFIGKIRSCNDWGELYDELRLESQFNIDMRNRIITELKQCRKV